MVGPVIFGDQLILGIETSCDETSAAVVRGQRVLSNPIRSQLDLHEKWGGVVPEAAARQHIEAILPVVDSALDEAGLGLNDLAGIAVTNRPGLVGALSVGVTYAKGLAYALSKPLIGVHHLEGHLVSPFLSRANPAPLPERFLALIVSGGHTELVAVRGLGNYEILAQTIDDAAGEAFDKSARLLGLGTPGGKAIQELARSGDPRRYALPRPMLHDPQRLSFSGLKTAVLRTVELEGAGLDRPGLAASLQAAIVDSLTSKVVGQFEQEEWSDFALVGGVAANVALRERLQFECQKRGVRCLIPEFEFCTDNAAMIALAGAWRLATGQKSDFSLACLPNADLPAHPGLVA